MNENTNPALEPQEKKPAGLIPRNVQSYIMIGVSLVLVILIWTTSSKKPIQPKEQMKPADNTEEFRRLNEGKLEEYKRELAAQEKILKNQSALLMEETDQEKDSHTSGTHSSSTSSGHSEGIPPEVVLATQLAMERQKREFNSLFADNVALSFRPKAKDPSEKDQLGNLGEPPTIPEIEHIKKEQVDDLAKLESSFQSQIKNTLGMISQAAAVGNPPNPSAAPNPPAELQPSQPAATSKKKPAENFSRAEGPFFRVLEGTVFETVLLNRINSDFAGPVQVMLTDPIHSHDRLQVLIPAGSKAIGEAQRVSRTGQNRVAITFHRLIMPDGYSVNLDQFAGLNQIGENALRDQVNNHYLTIFGASLALGAIAGFSSHGTSYGYNASASDAYRQGLADSISNSSQRILDRYLNILPTITIREGHRIKVFLTGDLLLPAYSSHQMPSDLTQGIGGSDQ